MFHRVIISSVLLCDYFLLHRVSQSFARSYTELLFPPYYFMIIFVAQTLAECYCFLCATLWVLCGTLWNFFFIAHSLSERFFPLCYSVSTLWYSVKLFFITHSLSKYFFSSVLLCEYSVKLFFYYTQSLRALFSSVLLCGTLWNFFFITHSLSERFFPLCHSVSTLCNFILLSITHFKHSKNMYPDHWHHNVR